MLKAIVYLFAAAGLIYFLFYPWLKHSVNRKKIFKWFLIVYGIAMLVSAVGTYVIGSGQPDSFTEGVVLIKNKSDIKDKIGEFKALKFDKKELPHSSDNPADLKFKLEGSKGILEIEGRVARKNNGKWQLVNIKKDSLIEQF